MSVIVLPSSSSTYPSLTRRQIRRLVGGDLAAEFFFVGHALAEPASDFDRFALAEFVDRAEGSEGESYRDRWAYIPATADSVRLVEIDTATGLAITHRNLARPLVESEEVEVHRWDARLINLGINDALTRMRFQETLQISADGGSYAVDLASYPYIQAKGDIVGVWSQNPATTLAPPLPADWWDAEFNGTSWELHLSSAYASQLFVKVRRPFPTLADDDDATLANPNWLRAGTRVEVLKRLLDRMGSGREAGSIQRQLGMALADFRRLSSLLQPRGGKRVQHSTPVWGQDYIESR